jgi:hypothetical protein
MVHVAALFAFKPQGLLLGGFGEFALKRVFLSAITFFLSFVVTFTFGQGSSFSRLVKTHGVNLVLFALWTVRADLLGNVHDLSL